MTFITILNVSTNHWVDEDGYWIIVGFDPEMASLGADHRRNLS